MAKALGLRWTPRRKENRETENDTAVNVFFNNELYSGFLKSKVQALIWSAATAGSHQTKITQMSKNIKMVNVNDYK